MGNLRVSNGYDRIVDTRPVSRGIGTFNFSYVAVSNGSFSRLRGTFSTFRGDSGPFTVVVGAIGNGNISCVRGTIN